MKTNIEQKGQETASGSQGGCDSHGNHNIHGGREPHQQPVPAEQQHSIHRLRRKPVAPQPAKCGKEVHLFIPSGGGLFTALLCMGLCAFGLVAVPGVIAQDDPNGRLTHPTNRAQKASCSTESTPAENSGRQTTPPVTPSTTPTDRPAAGATLTQSASATVAPSAWRPTLFSSVMYETETQILTLRFHSGYAYEYYHVPKNVFTELQSAESQGRYFNNHIRRRYVSRRIDHINRHQAAYNKVYGRGEKTAPTARTKEPSICPYATANWK